MKLQFLGAAQEVTGSCFLVEAGGARFLVDCGMHQGGREVQARNHLPWPFDPADIDFVPTSTTAACCPAWWRWASRGPSSAPAPRRTCSA